MATTIHFITTSKPKLEAFNKSKWWTITNMRLESECGSVSTDTAQPVGYEGGLAMARQRITRYKEAVAEGKIQHHSNAKLCNTSLGDIYLAVESYMSLEKQADGTEIWVDRALAVCQFGDQELITVSPELIHMPQEQIPMYIKLTEPCENKLGYKTTFGEYVEGFSGHVKIEKDDWYLHVRCGNTLNRQTHIRNLLNQIPLAPILKSHAPVYQDFPKPGVRFLDVISLLADATTKRMLAELVRDKLVCVRAPGMSLTHVVGLDARGFLLGMLIADLYNIPFIPIRKAGKLPPSPGLQRVEFTTEYSTDAFEMSHQPSIKPTSRVLVVDDILATGGTIRAALQLLEKYQLRYPPKILVAEDVLGLEHTAAIADNLVVLFKD